MKILLAQINPTIGDLEGNTDKILKGITHAKNSKVQIALFPELALTGYPPEDFLLLPHFIQALDIYLEKIKQASTGLTVIVGTPRLSNEVGKHLYNSAAIFTNGQLVGFQDKCLLPTYDVFTERRYFEPGGPIRPWTIEGKKIAITICEDLWQHSTLLESISYPRDPVLDLSYYKPDLVLNLSASPYSIGKIEKRINVCMRVSKTLHCPVLLCNQVGGNDGLIFDGSSIYVDAAGNTQSVAKTFEEDFKIIDLESPPTSYSYHGNPTKELYNALILGIKDYFKKAGFTKACLGLSGGIDSAVVACLAVEALGKENVLGVLMPSRYSSEGSVSDAIALAKNLDIPYKEIPIETPFASYLELLTPHFNALPTDSTEENLQARIRGMLLMALSNKLGYIVLSTGNKSELAMGYATLYGDMCGGLAILSDLSKRQVYALANWINGSKEVIPLSTIKKSPSAELRPNQKDSDSLPDYEILDNVLEAYVEKHYSPDQISKLYNYPLQLVEDLITRIHRNEYKRRQSPPGLRVTEKAFSVGRRFPIVQRWI